MKQTDLAKSFGVSKEWFNAVVCGRDDAGKKLAAKISGTVGGKIETWVFPQYRKSRKKILDKFLVNVGRAGLSNSEKP